MGLLFFKYSVLGKRRPISKFRFYRGPFFIPKASETTEVDGVPVGIKAIQDILQKKVNGEQLGPTDQTTIDAMTAAELFEATVSYVSKLPSSLNELKVGDIVKLKFQLKFISLQKETNKSFVNENPSRVLADPVNPLKLAPPLLRKIYHSSLWCDQIGIEDFIGQFSLSF